MNTDPVTLSLPFLTWQGLNVLLAALGVAGATGLVWLMLTGAERDHPPKLESWFKPMVVVLGVVWVWLLGATLRALWQVFNGEPSPLAGGSLGLGALIAAFLGAPFVIYGTYLRHKTQRLEQEGHMTDRINKAVEQLGAQKEEKRLGRAVTIRTKRPEGFEEIVTEVVFKGEEFSCADNDEVEEGEWKEYTLTVPNIEVRMGAILSLERIAQDSTTNDKGRDHVRVMEILCAYIRENTKTPDLSTESDEDSHFSIRTDVQIALDVIKRRNQSQHKIEEVTRYRLDLRECDFRGADFSKGSFRGAIFARCRFEFAQLNDSDFSGARFHESVLNYVWAVRASFIGAIFHSIRIDKPRPTAGGFVRSINLSELKGASFAGADISAIQYFRENMPTFGTKDTLLSVEMENQRSEIIKNARKSGITSIGSVESTGDVSSTFASWSPYESSDGMTGHLLKEFYDRIELSGWPFCD